MAKYNLTEMKVKEASYRDSINSALMDDLKDKILHKILIEKKYKDKTYSAKTLAQDLETNTRYISGVCYVKFHMNYTSFVNKYRIEEAMTLLADIRYAELTIDDIANLVGFASRQSFYGSFYKLVGITPREYRLKYMPKVEKAQKESSSKKNKKGKK